MDTIRTSKQCPFERGVCYRDVLPKLVYFPSKTCSRVLTPKYVKRPILGVELKTLVGKCLQCVKEPTNEVDEIAVAGVRPNSRCKEEVVYYV